MAIDARERLIEIISTAIANSQRALELLRSGDIRTHEIHDGRQRDTTDEAIRRHEEIIAYQEGVLAGLLNTTP